MNLNYSQEEMQSLAEKGLILEGEVGSTALGLSIAGTSDVDLMGVTIEPSSHFASFYKFEQYESRTAMLRAQEKETSVHNEKALPDDVERKIYSLRKFGALAAGGNPSILMLLYTHPTFASDLGKKLQSNRDIFISKQAGEHYAGYLFRQKERLMGRMGQMRIKRSELVEKFGYDTKYASHALRLGYQGVELLTNGSLELPLKEEYKKDCLSVRRGEWTLDQTIQKIEEVEKELFVLTYGKPFLPHRAERDLRKGTSQLRENTDLLKVNDLISGLYKEAWAQNDISL